MDNRGPGQALVAASHLLRNAAGVCLVLFLVLALFPVSGELPGILTVAFLLVAAVCRLAAWGVQPSFAPAGGRLEASRHPEGLCLEAHFEGDEHGSGACGFSDAPGSGRYVVSVTDSGGTYAYGPVPRQASTVRLRLGDGSSIEAPTAELPQGLADGRYFFTDVERGAVIDSVLILDAAGATVEPRDF